MPRVRACIICGKPSVPGRSRCEIHGGKAWKRTDPASKHRYGKDWQARRARVLREEPNCRLCGARTSEADHIVAHADGGTDARSNLRGLCGDCHKKHTAEQNRARRKRRRQEKP
jgi:5-methylcytosine-specific restriction protein A